jgi:hypothetical protein
MIVRAGNNCHHWSIGSGGGDWNHAVHLELPQPAALYLICRRDLVVTIRPSFH